MKRYAIKCLALVCLISAMALPVGATAESKVYQSTEFVYMEGYGQVQVDTTLVVQTSLLRASSKSAKKIQTYTYDGSEIATVTLSATFSYGDGKVSVTSASGSASTSGGWSYKSQSVVKSGGTASLTAKLTKLSYRDIPVSISMSCTTAGVIR